MKSKVTAGHAQSRALSHQADVQSLAQPAPNLLGPRVIATSVGREMLATAPRRAMASSSPSIWTGFDDRFETDDLSSYTYTASVEYEPGGLIFPNNSGSSPPIVYTPSVAINDNKFLAAIYINTLEGFQPCIYVGNATETSASAPGGQWGYDSGGVSVTATGNDLALILTTNERVYGVADVPSLPYWLWLEGSGDQWSAGISADDPRTVLLTAAVVATDASVDDLVAGGNAAIVTAVGAGAGTGGDGGTMVIGELFAVTTSDPAPSTNTTTVLPSAGSVGALPAREH